MTSVMIRAHAERVYAASSPTGVPITQVRVPNPDTHHRGSVAPIGGFARLPTCGCYHALRLSADGGCAPASLLWPDGR